METKELLWQRYDDADLALVDQAITLAESYDRPRYAAIILMIAGVYWSLSACGSFGSLCVVAIRSWSLRPDLVSRNRLAPVNILALLKDIDRNDGLKPAMQSELLDSISRIEHYCFAECNGEPTPNLYQLAVEWVRRAVAVC